MREAPQMLLLFLGECHWAIIVVSRQMPKRSKKSVLVGSSETRQATSSVKAVPQKEGWRSRAVFKLAQIQQTERLLRPGIRLRRLGRGPRRLEPVRRTHCRRQRPHRGDRYPGDGSHTRRRLRAGGLPRGGGVGSSFAVCRRRQGRPCFVRYGPNMAGIDAVDQPRSMYLAELALEFADRVLAPGGDLLLKLFQGAGFDQILKDTRTRYARVVTKKPKASRTRSPEIYLLARQFGMGVSRGTRSAIFPRCFAAVR